MGTESLVLAALKEKNPALHQQLTSQGKLRAFLTDQAQEIDDQISTLATRLEIQQGKNKARTLVEAAAISNTAEKMATEIVLAEMLQFPQDETSPPSPDETSSSETPT